MGFSVTGAIRRHVEARVKAALGPVARRVDVVTARLGDVNADRGGVDKQCRFVVSLRRHGVVVAEATDADLYTAVEAAAARARRAALRSVARRLPRGRTDAWRRPAPLAAG